MSSTVCWSLQRHMGRARLLRSGPVEERREGLSRDIQTHAPHSPSMTQAQSVAHPHSHSRPFSPRLTCSYSVSPCSLTPHSHTRSHTVILTLTLSLLPSHRHPHPHFELQSHLHTHSLLPPFPLTLVHLHSLWPAHSYHQSSHSSIDTLSPKPHPPCFLSSCPILEGPLLCSADR